MSSSLRSSRLLSSEEMARKNGGDEEMGVQIDKEGANPERAKQEISEAGLMPEEWGGDTPMIEVSPDHPSICYS